MSNSLIIKKEESWFILPDIENRNEVIISLIEQENPDYMYNGEELDEVLLANGWTMQEYRDLTEVA